MNRTLWRRLGAATAVTVVTAMLVADAVERPPADGADGLAAGTEAVMPSSTAAEHGDTHGEDHAPALPPAPPLTPDDVLDLDLPGPVVGPDAVAALGEQLSLVAARQDVTPAELTEAFQDPTLGVGTDGVLFYVETAAEAAEQLVESDPQVAGALAAPVVPLDQTFALHSKPGSARTVYLDFDGHTVTGTGWNSSHGVPSGFHIGYSLDGSYGSFSEQERRIIQDVWQRVAEDYAAFDVDVTTQDPGLAALTRTSSSDTTWGTRALITDTAGFPTMCGSGCSGVAYVGTANATGVGERYSPAWIKGNLYENTPRAMAHVISHEVGHTFGLQHASTTTSAYYSGHENWGPLMGSPSSRGVSQWTDHTYPGAVRSTIQDGDDVVTLGRHGLAPRGDEAPDSTSGAPAVSGSGSAGYISTRSDRDTWAIGRCSGPVTVQVASPHAEANLDVGLTVLDSSGAVLGSTGQGSGQTAGWPPEPTGMDASLSVTNGGQMWARIDGIGRTNVYSDYGSIGAYVIRVSCAGSTGGSTPPATVQPGLAQVTGRPEVWLVNGSSRHHVPTMAELTIFMSRLGGIRAASASAIEALPQGAPATRLVTDERNKSRWVLQAGGTRHAVDAERATAYGHRDDTAITLKGAQVDAFTPGAAVGDFYLGDGDPRVFLREGTTRRYVTTMGALNAVATNATLVRLPASATSGLTDGPALLQPHTLVRQDGRNDVYLVLGNSGLLHVPSFGLARDAGATVYTVVAGGSLTRNPVTPGSLAPLARCGGTTYLASGGRLRPTSGAETTGLAPVDLPSTACGGLPKAAAVAAPLFVQQPGRPEVFWVEGGRLHHVRTYPLLLVLNGARLLDLVSWSGETTSLVGQGAPLLVPGSFVQFPGDAAVYQGDGRTIRQVTSFAALLRLGGGLVPLIERLPTDYRAFYTVGTPVL